MLGNMEVQDYIKSMCPKYFPALDASRLVIRQANFKERSTYPIVKLDIAQTEEPSNVAASIVVKTAPQCVENVEGLTEYENMSAVKGLFEKISSSKFENKALGFINPLEYNHQLNVLVTEFVPHQRLSQKLFNACSSYGSFGAFESVKQDIYSSGRWLRLFHQIKSGSRKLLEETDYYDRIEFYLQHARNIGLEIPAIKKAEQFYKTNKDRLSKLNLPTGLIHGDYGPQNIGVGNDDGKVYVFDLQRNYEECIYHDITYFLVTLETLNPYPKHYTFSRKKLLALGQDFLIGYRKNKEINSGWNDLLFHVYYLRSLLERVRKQSMNNRIGKRGWFSNLILKKYMRFTFESKIQREIDIIDRLLNS